MCWCRRPRCVYFGCGEPTVKARNHNTHLYSHMNILVYCVDVVSDDGAAFIAYWANDNAHVKCDCTGIVDPYMHSM